MTVSGNVGRHLLRWRRDDERPQRFVVRLVNAHGLTWTQATLSQVELGRRRVTVDELAVLAVVLDVEPCVLLRPTGQESETR